MEETKVLRKNHKGFTLVELIIVIAILGVLSALIVPRIMGNVKDAQKQTDITNAQVIASEITMHNAKAKQGDATIPAALPTPGATVVVAATDITSLSLPSDITFPKNTNVDIVVDSKGNASIDVK